MSAITPLIPRKPVPELTLPTLEGNKWVAGEPVPETFSMLVFYRGLHCPVCRLYLSDLQEKIKKFRERGVDVTAISSDAEVRARQSKKDWKLPDLRIAWGLEIAAARKWGLYISSGRGKSSNGIIEPDRFSEPGLFLLRPDRTLYFASVQTMPFARPHFDDILNAIDYVVANDYPARGEMEIL